MQLLKGEAPLILPAYLPHHTCIQLLRGEVLLQKCENCFTLQPYNKVWSFKNSFYTNFRRQKEDKEEKATGIENVQIFALRELEQATLVFMLQFILALTHPPVK